MQLAKIQKAPYLAVEDFLCFYRSYASITGTTTAVVIKKRHKKKRDIPATLFHLFIAVMQFLFVCLEPLLRLHVLEDLLSKRRLCSLP